MLLSLFLIVVLSFLLVLVFLAGPRSLLGYLLWGRLWTDALSGIWSMIVDLCGSLRE